MPRSSLLFLACLLASMPLAGTSFAQAEEKRAVVGKCLSPTGVLLSREAAGKRWQTIGPLDPVMSGDLLLALPGGRAALKSSDGAVHLHLWGNLPDQSASPVLESAVVLHATPGFDLDLGLDRGRVVVTNHRDKGPAKVRVRVRGETWDLTLAEPGASAALERYGRWPRGAQFSIDPRKAGEPTAALSLFVLKGQVDLKAGTQQHALSAPPGPASFQWNSIAGNAAGPERRDQQPDWLDGKQPVLLDREQVRAVLDRFARDFRERPAAEALAGLLAASDDLAGAPAILAHQQVAVLGLGALDDLARLTDALGDEKRAGARATAVEGLRHWLGREPGRDQAVYRLLIDEKKFTPAHAEIVLALLHSFSVEDLARRETYEALLGYLGHDRLPIRELARWHLERLVPGGNKIGFNAAGTAEQRAAAVQEWKKRVQESLEKPKPKEEK